MTKYGGGVASRIQDGFLRHTLAPRDAASAGS